MRRTFRAIQSLQAEGRKNSSTSTSFGAVIVSWKRRLTLGRASRSGMLQRLDHCEWSFVAKQIELATIARPPRSTTDATHKISHDLAGDIAPANQDAAGGER